VIFMDHGAIRRARPPERIFSAPGETRTRSFSPSLQAEATMDGWSRFLDAFFKPELIERYFPAIMKGVVVTVEVATAVVVTGLAGARSRAG